MKDWKFQQIEPQPARGELVASLWTDEDWICEEKYDGDRRIVQFTWDEVHGIFPRFTGRRIGIDGKFVEKTANLPQFKKAPAEMIGTVLDGEIVAPSGVTVKGGQSKCVTAVMGSSPAEAIRKQKEGGYLRFVAFDCLFFKGKDVRNEPWHHRWNLMDLSIRTWHNAYAHPSCPIYGKEKKLYYDQLINFGGEGVVLKERFSHYGTKQAWVKVKGEQTDEVVIMGFTPGKGKYAGQIGAIEFGQFKQAPRRTFGTNGYVLTPCGQCSGMDDALRGVLSRHGKKYLGQVMEIKHNGREPSGAFRHPRFVRFRDDKESGDCRWE